MCPDYQKLDKQKCYFQGKYVNIGERIRDDRKRYDICYRCYCSQIREDVASFTRCYSGCGGCEHFGDRIEDDGCIYQYPSLSRYPDQFCGKFNLT